MHNHAALAQLYYDKGRYTQCMGQARRALAIDDSFVKPHCILGFTHLQVGRMTPNLPLRIEHFEKAERELIAAISHGSETNSYVFKCYFGLGLLYFQWAKAVDAIREEQGSQDKSGLPPPIPGEEKIWQE
jgi:tetratricopeptide (TPR) repeat protein